MIIVASTNGKVGIKKAVEVLKSGGSAMDAVEAGIHMVEDNPEDYGVGYGGLPNILGEVELDASIMDGKSLTAGAVGCLRGFRHPISIARKVMEELPHVFLVGPGAERFASEFHFEKREMLSEAAAKTYKEKLLEYMPQDVIDHLAEQPDLAHWIKILSDPKRPKGTVNFLALDARGNLCTGVSTSGWFFKYPGRLGDSPVIGAGNYADNRYGAAACTGMGEMAIRSGTARSTVLYMKMGLSLEAAGKQAMEDLNDLGGKYLSDMNIVALDRQGNHAGFSNNSEGATYIYQTDKMDEPLEVNRIYVENTKHWG